jgi:hypothetical protein
MSELQQAVLDFVHAHHEARKEAPSTADVRHHFRFRNEAGVLHALDALAAAGHFVRSDDRWRLKEPQVQLHFPLTVDPAGLPPR